MIGRVLGRRELGGGPGQIFLRGLLFKNFFRKIFFRTSTLQLLSRDLNSIFPTKFWCFAPPPKKCPLRRNISPQKMTGAQQKISWGPQNLGARGNLPPPAPLSRRPWSCIDQIIYLSPPQSLLKYLQITYMKFPE